MKSESEVAQSCPTPSNPMDCSPPGSSVHESFQARVLEWGAIPFVFICYCEEKKKNCPTKFQKQRNLSVYLMRQEIAQNILEIHITVLLMEMNANTLNPILKNEFNDKYLKSL